tara:strand:+ start:1992 stop:3176 length:1185 start_codon:yes stop_codon:yes gene_type:complete
MKLGVSNKGYIVLVSLFAFSLPLKENWSSIALIFLIIYSLIIFFNKKEYMRIKDFFSHNNFMTKLFFLGFMFLILGLFSFFINGGVVHDFDFKRLSFPLLFFVFVLFFSLKIFKIVEVKYFMISFFVGLSLSGFIRVFTGIQDFFINDKSFLFSRIGIPFEDMLSSNPIIYGVFINICWAYFLIDFLKTRTRRLQFSLLFLTLTLFLSTNFSLTGAVLIIFNSFFIITFYYNKRIYKLQVITVLVLSVIGFVFLLQPSGKLLLSRVEGESSRVRNYETSQKLFKNLPFFGYGVGNELSTLQDNRNIKSWEYINKYHAHNQYFEFLIGGGWPYLINYVLIIGLTVIYALKIENILLVSFMVTIIITMYFESLLVIHKGLLLVAFLLSYLILVNDR